MTVKQPGGENAAKGHLALAVAYIIFGLNITVSKAVLGNDMVSSFALSTFRMVGAAVLFWTASLFMKREKVPVKDILKLALAGLFGIVCNQNLFLMGLSYTSPVDASIVSTLVPAVTMVIAAFYLKEPITWKKVLGVLIGAAGVLMLILTGRSASQQAGSVAGNLMVLGSVCSYSIYLAVFKPVVVKYRPVTLMKWMFLSAALVTLPFGWRDTAAIDYSLLDAQTVWGIIYVVGCATFVSYFLVPIGQQNLRPTIVGMYNYVQPIVAYAVAVAVGMDSFGWEKTLAALLVFLGVYVVNTSKSRAQVEAGK